MKRCHARSELINLVVGSRHRAARLCVEATTAVAAASGGQVAFEGAPWNSNTVDLIRLARAHCLLVLHSTFADSVHRLDQEVLCLALCCHEHYCICRANCAVAALLILYWILITFPIAGNSASADTCGAVQADQPLCSEHHQPRGWRLCGGRVPFQSTGESPFLANVYQVKVK